MINKIIEINRKDYFRSKPEKINVCDDMVRIQMDMKIFQFKKLMNFLHENFEVNENLKKGN